MKSSINQSIVYITGKLSEESKIEATYLGMMEEFNSMVIIESFGNDSGHEKVEVTLSYSSDEATVSTVKESYSEAKKAA